MVARRDHMIMSVCQAANACSLARHWQTHLPGRLICPTPQAAGHSQLGTSLQTHMPGRLTCPMPLLYTQVQYQNGTGGSYVENPRHSVQHQLASHLVRAPNSRSGGHEFGSPVRQELTALTKSGKTLGVRPVYTGTFFFYCFTGT